MRRTVAVASLLCLVSSAAVARGEDAPPPPVVAPAPSAPSTPVDAVDRLVASLLEDRGATRALAEEAVAHADPSTLRAIVLKLRDRLDVARLAGDAAGRPDKPASPPTVGIAHEVEWARIALEHLDAALSTPAPELDPVVLAGTPERLGRWAEALRAGVVTHLTQAEGSSYDGQRAEVAVLSERAVVDDVELRTVAGGPTIADPVIGQVRTGARLAFTPRRRLATGPVEVAFDAEVRRLVEPIAQEALSLLDKGATVQVQRPEVIAARWERTVTLPEAGEVFVVFPRGFSPTEDERLVLRFRARPLAFAEATEPRKPR